LDNPGIWFGDIGVHLWFTDQEFCTIGCMLSFIKRFWQDHKNNLVP
jgi:hypothetical protein